MPKAMGFPAPYRKRPKKFFRLRKMFAEKNPGERQKVDAAFDTFYVDPGAFTVDGGVPVIDSRGIVPKHTAVGPRGNSGAIGPKGFRGPRGSKGTAGPQGPPGLDGTGIDCRPEIKSQGRGERYDLILYGGDPGENQLCAPGSFIKNRPRAIIPIDKVINRVVLGLTEYGGFESLGDDCISIGKKALGWAELPRQGAAGLETLSVGAYAGSYYGQQEYAITLGAFAASGAFIPAVTNVEEEGQGRRAVAIGAGAAAGVFKFKQGSSSYVFNRSNTSSGQLEGSVAVGFNAALQGQSTSSSQAYGLPRVPAVAIGALAGGSDTDDFTSLDWTGQYPASVAIGYGAGQSGVGTGAVSIGAFIGTTSVENSIPAFSVMIGHATSTNSLPGIEPVNALPVSAPVAVGRQSVTFAGGVSLGTGAETVLGAGVTPARTDMGPVSIGHEAVAAARFSLKDPAEALLDLSGGVNSVAVGASAKSFAGDCTVIGAGSSVTDISGLGTSGGVTIIGSAQSQVDVVTGKFFTSIGKTMGGGVTQDTGNFAIAIGSNSAFGGLFNGAISIGNKDGLPATLDEKGISIGTGAGGSQDDGGISIGRGAAARGFSSICIGVNATTEASATNSIVLTSTGTGLVATRPSTWYVEPVTVTPPISGCGAGSDTFANAQFCIQEQSTAEILAHTFSTITVGTYLSTSLTVTAGSDFKGDVVMEDAVVTISGATSEMSLTSGHTFIVGCGPGASTNQTVIAPNSIDTNIVIADNANITELTTDLLSCTDGRIGTWTADGIDVRTLIMDGELVMPNTSVPSLSIQNAGTLVLAQHSVLTTTGGDNLELTSDGLLTSTLFTVTDAVTCAGTTLINPSKVSSNPCRSQAGSLTADSIDVTRALWLPCVGEFTVSSAYTNTSGSLTAGGPPGYVPLSNDFTAANVTICGGASVALGPPAPPGFDQSHTWIGGSTPETGAGLENYSGGIIVWGEPGGNCSVAIGDAVTPGAINSGVAGHLIEFDAVTVGSKILTDTLTAGSVTAGIHTHTGGTSVIQNLQAFVLETGELEVDGNLTISIVAGYTVGIGGNLIVPTGTVTIGGSTVKVDGNTLRVTEGSAESRLQTLSPYVGVTEGSMTYVTVTDGVFFCQDLTIEGSLETATIVADTVLPGTSSGACNTWQVGQAAINSLRSSGAAGAVNLFDGNLTVDGNLELPPNIVTAAGGFFSLCDGEVDTSQVQALALHQDALLYLRAPDSQIWRFSLFNDGDDPTAEGGRGYVSTPWPSGVDIPRARCWPRALNQLQGRPQGSILKSVFKIKSDNFSPSHNLPFVDFTLPPSGAASGIDYPTATQLLANIPSCIGSVTVGTATQLEIDLRRLQWLGGDLAFWAAVVPTYSEAPVPPDAPGFDGYTITSFGGIGLPENQTGSGMCIGSSLSFDEEHNGLPMKDSSLYGGPHGLTSLVAAFTWLGNDPSSPFVQKTWQGASLGTWDVSNVEEFTGAFEVFFATLMLSGKTEPLGVDLTEWDVSRGTDFSAMFSGRDFTSSSTPPSSWSWRPCARSIKGGTVAPDAPAQAPGVNGTFRFCKFGPGDWSGWDVGRVALFGRAGGPGGSPGCFESTSWSAGAHIFDGWKPGLRYKWAGADLDSMWKGGTQTAGGTIIGGDNFNGTITNWDTSNVGTTTSMFQMCYSFGTVGSGSDFSSWDVSNIKNASFMFSGNDAESDVSFTPMGFELMPPGTAWSSANSLESMFRNCTSFNQDISDWTFGSLDGTGGVKSMFRNCSSFRSGVAAGSASSSAGHGLGPGRVWGEFDGTPFWTLSQGTNYEEMFLNSAAGSTAPQNFNAGAVSLSFDYSVAGGWWLENVLRMPRIAVNTGIGNDNWFNPYIALTPSGTTPGDATTIYALPPRPSYLYSQDVDPLLADKACGTMMLWDSATGTTRLPTASFNGNGYSTRATMVTNVTFTDNQRAAYVGWSSETAGGRFVAASWGDACYSETCMKVFAAGSQAQPGRAYASAHQTIGENNWQLPSGPAVVPRTPQSLNPFAVFDFNGIAIRPKVWYAGVDDDPLDPGGIINVDSGAFEDTELSISGGSSLGVTLDGRPRAPILPVDASDMFKGGRLGSLSSGATAALSNVFSVSSGATTLTVGMFENNTITAGPFTFDGWDVSNVVSMERMFKNCQQFNCLLSTWDVSSCTTMTSMFQDATSYEVVPFPIVGSYAGLELWDVSSVVTMESMFEGCTSINRGLGPGGGNQTNIGDWPVANVRNMQNMFKGCTSLNSALSSMNLSNWDVYNVATMEGMFQDCTNLKQLSGTAQWSVNNVKTMKRMFQGCETTVFSPSFLFTLGSGYSIENTDYMFKGCTNTFAQSTYPFPPTSMEAWDVSSITTCAGMFEGCIQFNRNLSQWDVSNVIDSSAMFKDATVFRAGVAAGSASSSAGHGLGPGRVWGEFGGTPFWTLSQGCNYEEMFLNSAVGSTTPQTFSAGGESYSFDYNVPGGWWLENVLRMPRIAVNLGAGNDNWFNPYVALTPSGTTPGDATTIYAFPPRPSYLYSQNVDPTENNRACGTMMLWPSATGTTRLPTASFIALGYAVYNTIVTHDTGAPGARAAYVGWSSETAGGRFVAASWGDACYSETSMEIWSGGGQAQPGRAHASARQTLGHGSWQQPVVGTPQPVTPNSLNPFAVFDFNGVAIRPTVWYAANTETKPSGYVNCVEGAFEDTELTLSSASSLGQTLDGRSRAPILPTGTTSAGQDMFLQATISAGGPSLEICFTTTAATNCENFMRQATQLGSFNLTLSGGCNITDLRRCFFRLDTADPGSACGDYPCLDDFVDPTVVCNVAAIFQKSSIKNLSCENGLGITKALESCFQKTEQFEGTLDLSGWNFAPPPLPGGLSMLTVFEDCGASTILAGNLPHVRTRGLNFKNCSNLKHVSFTSGEFTLTSSNETGLREEFRGCEKLVSFGPPASEWNLTSSQIWMPDRTFKDCTLFSADLSGWILGNGTVGYTNFAQNSGWTCFTISGGLTEYAAPPLPFTISSGGANVPFNPGTAGLTCSGELLPAMTMTNVPNVIKVRDNAILGVPPTTNISLTGGAFLIPYQRNTDALPPARDPSLAYGLASDFDDPSTLPYVSQSAGASFNDTLSTVGPQGAPLGLVATTTYKIYLPLTASGEVHPNYRLTAYPEGMGGDTLAVINLGASGPLIMCKQPLNFWSMQPDVDNWPYLTGANRNPDSHVILNISQRVGWGFTSTVVGADDTGALGTPGDKSPAGNPTAFAKWLADQRLSLSSGVTVYVDGSRGNGLLTYGLSVPNQFTGADSKFTQWDLSDCTSLQNCFKHTRKLVGVGLEDWNVGKVTNFENMFEAAFDFNRNLNKWKSSPSTIASGVNFDGMFEGAAPVSDNDFNNAGVPMTWTVTDGATYTDFALDSALTSALLPFTSSGGRMNPTEAGL